MRGHKTTGFTPHQHGEHMEAARIGAGKQRTIRGILGSEQSQERGAEKGYGHLIAAASDAGGAGRELNCFAADTAIAAWRMLALPLLVCPPKPSLPGFAVCIKSFPRNFWLPLLFSDALSPRLAGSQASFI